MRTNCFPTSRKSKNCFFLLLLLWTTMSAEAQPTAPILRLENGMHTAKASRIATDAQGKYLLTSSDDKTARLWDASSGKLLQTYRIPIGGTDEGKVYACALSPDGRYAVLGGWTGWEWDESHSIYVIQLQTGNIVHRITGMSSVINDLEFTEDGKWLGIALAGTSGVRIYKTSDWSEYKKIEAGYEAQTANIAFDKNNRFVTVSYDAKVRLYDASFNLIQTKQVTSGQHPYSVSFTPDNNFISIGYSDATDVEIRSSTDLSLQFKPDVELAAKSGERINKLCFSPDGNVLFGAGTFSLRDADNHWKYVIRRWSDRGKGQFKDLPLMNNIIMDIKPLPNGTIAVVGSNPDVALLSASGDVLWYKTAGALDFSARDKSHFRVNAAGSVFSMTPLNETPLMFDVLGRTLSAQASQYSAPTAENGGTVVTDWLANDNPRINGIIQNYMDRYERCISTDVSGDGSAVIIGADWYLYKVNNKGEKQWAASLPEVAYAVNITGNDKLVMAVLGDGSVHWYGMADGKELLTFFLHSDKKRWVLFTPSGYYDSSPGAEDLIGWHVNKGKDGTPGFYPVSRFRETYHRPDIVDAIFETNNEAQAIVLANSRDKKTHTDVSTLQDKLPPTVTITGPLNGSTVGQDQVRVTYTLNTPADAPVKNVKVLVNGRPVALQRGIETQPSNKYSVDVTIPQEECTITLLAENDNGVSPEANLLLKFKAVVKNRDDFVRKPKLYVLAIGISQYTNPDYKLRFAHSDADAFAKSLIDQKGKLYGDVIVKPLLNGAATREAIQDGLQWIQEQTGQQDVAMIFFAGHGMNDNNGLFYMLPVGADVARLRSTCLNFEELKQTVSSIAGKVVVFIDACHSGNVMGSTARRGTGGDINDLVNELSSTQNGAITFTSSTGKEYSLEDPSWEHGAFTKALLEGLSGQAAIPGKGKITVKSLDAYISERVKELTKGKQHPTSVVPPNVPDFPIGIPH
jgi:WD40 repeat protein